MQKLAEIRLQPEVLAQYELPDLPYPIYAADAASALGHPAHPWLAAMLHGLQQESAASADWQALDPAKDRLAQLLTAGEWGGLAISEGESWWLELGPVDLGGTLVTIQRAGQLIAAMESREDGRLRVAVFRPLDVASAAKLIALGQRPHPEHGVCMREDNWEYALDCAAANGNAYAAEQGEAYLSYWASGLGLSSNADPVGEWFRQRTQIARPAARVATELRVHYSLSLAPRSDSNAATHPGTAQAERADAEALPEGGWAGRRQQRRTVLGRFTGCLLGGAVGDALGAPVEFMARADILARFGPEGITHYAPAFGGVGRITDDTQMTLFTAEGLLRGWVRGCFKGITSYSSVTAHAYMRWLATQGERSDHGLLFGTETAGWLSGHAALHSRRAPGNTCMSALKSMAHLGMPARNNSKGCGGVMRVAPVGLFAWRLGHHGSATEAFRLAVELAALTHGDPTGSLAAGAFAVLVLVLTDGAPLPQALFAAKAALRTAEDHEETLRALELAEHLARSGRPHEEAIAQLGQGWVAEEALSIAVYCALVAGNFREGLILAVNHDGDSDSTGSMAGNLLGALYGVKAIPAEWLEPLELRDVIAELAQDLHTFADWNVGEYGEDEELNQRIWQKYPGY